LAEPLQFAVIGHPIAHSRSPEIHAAFARQFNIDLQYRRIDALPEAFEQCVRDFFAAGGRGMNVTLPYKEVAFYMCQAHSPRAVNAKAVNTLDFDGQMIVGDNTDGAGLVHDLQRLARQFGRTLRGQRILLIGAGGAARGCVAPLVLADVHSISIAARDATRANTLARSFHPGLSETPVLAIDTTNASDFDIVINATSAGLSGSAPAMLDQWLENAWLAYDLGYPHGGQDSTPFLEACRGKGVANSADGLGMLVEQAAESFLVWHGRRPDTTPVLQMLRGSAP
jgi:shikimate dehydrogenase